MRAGIAVSLLLAAAAPAVAQHERYTLGQRLKAFEAEWEKVTDAAPRTRALEIVPKATTQFLSFQPKEAGRTLDLSRFALLAADPPPAAWQWAAALDPLPESRLIDAAKRELAVTVDLGYPLKAAMPKGLEVHAWFTNDAKATATPEKFPFTLKVPVPPLGDARGLDRRLYLHVAAGKFTATKTVLISQIAEPAERIAALKKAVAAPVALDTIERATVRDRATQLADLAAGEVPETDTPAAALLENAEAMAAGKPFFGPEKPGRFWLSVPLGDRKTAPVRVFIPKGLDAAKPVPVVVALHGAGGSENLFFEGYGGGRVVAECEKRGWVLVTTRAGPLGFTSVPPVPEVVKALAGRYPIDPKRVFLVGHSMGAAHTVELLQRNPGAFAGAAALGGGWRVAKPEAVGQTPLFVGVGEKDTIALAGAKGLHKTLTAAGSKAVTFKEYAGIEHMLIVREALADAFAVFDAAKP